MDNLKDKCAIVGIGETLYSKSSGKSELALDLVSRGHQLIADDAPEFTRVAPDTINGTCPELLQDFIEVRGLGILNIRAMYGDNAITENKHLKLIIDLFPPRANVPKSKDRVQLPERKTNILGIDIPTISLPVASGRNLAVLVEAAVRDRLLAKNGYNASENFILRQKMQCGK